MGERLQSSDFPLCSFGLELLVKAGYVASQLFPVECVPGEVSKLPEVCLVCLSGFGTEGFLLGAECYVFPDGFL